MGCIKALFKKLNTADADAVVLGFSPASGGHVSNMLVPEGIALIRHLKSLDPDEKAAEVMRRKMDQKHKAQVTKITNEYNRRKELILKSGDIFSGDLLAALEEDYKHSLIVLKERYCM